MTPLSILSAVQLNAALFKVALILNTAIRLTFVALICFSVPLAKASDETTENLLFSAIKKYQEKDYKTATTGFEELLRRNPKDSGALFNLGLVHYQEGSIGKSLGYFRKAKSLGLDIAQYDSAIKFILESNKGIKLAPSTTLQSLFDKIDQYCPTILIWIFLAMVVGHFGFHYLNYLKAKKEAIEMEQPIPGLKLHILGSFVCALFLLALAILQVQFQSQVWGTITSKKVVAYSAPSTDAPQLFEVSEGTELQILNKKNTWLQISMPSSQNENSGWIEAEHLFITSRATL